MRIRYQNELKSLKRKKSFKAFTLAIFVIGIGGVVFIANLFVPDIIADVSAQNTLNNYVTAASFQTPPKVLNIQDPKYKTSIKTVDARAFVLDRYFKLHNSPMYGTGSLIVKKCDQYKAPKDCTIVAAIAHAETDLCKYYNSASYYNCWGYGGAGPNRVYFKSWEESINAMYRTLSNPDWYGNYKMKNPKAMQRTFCGPQAECEGWGNRVEIFMRDINKLAKDMGIKEGMFGFRD